MERRIEYILAVAALFAGYLQPGGNYSKAFPEVDFAILSSSGKSHNYKVFSNQFS